MYVMMIENTHQLYDKDMTVITVTKSIASL